MSVTFADLGLPRELTSPLAKAGITIPFPIQEATIPDAIAGRDVLGRAPTGSGKTLAFGLPILATISKAAPHKPHALILSPTRELAEQIRRELAPVAAGRGLRLLTVYGGVSYHPQRSKLRQGVDVLIACPGRLIDLMEGGDVRLDAVTHVVIDEADRMADMGFMPQVRTLLDQTPRDRQTVMFSATLDGDVAKLTAHYQNNPVRHEVGTDALDSGTARHHFWRVDQANRVDQVADVVSAFESTLVFTRTRRGADRLAHQLGGHGIHAAAIHGGRTQRQRDRALREFTNGKVEVMVATDVAARGIHVDGVDCVVHFDPPEDHKAYLHRSGRTARAGAGGHVVSMVLGDQVRESRRLQGELGINDVVSEPSMDSFHDEGGQALGKLTERSRSGGNRGRSNNGRRGSRSGQGRSQSGGRDGQRSNSSRRDGRSDGGYGGTRSRNSSGTSTRTNGSSGSSSSRYGGDSNRSSEGNGNGNGNGQTRGNGNGNGQARRSAGNGNGQSRRGGNSGGSNGNVRRGANSGGGQARRGGNSGGSNGNVRRDERNVDGNVRRDERNVDGNVRRDETTVDGNVRRSSGGNGNGNGANGSGNRRYGSGNRNGARSGQPRRNSGGSQRSSRSR